jgi:hypothetical protein
MTTVQEIGTIKNPGGQSNSHPPCTTEKQPSAPIIVLGLPTDTSATTVAPTSEIVVKPVVAVTVAPAPTNEKKKKCVRKSDGTTSASASCKKKKKKSDQEPTSQKTGRTKKKLLSPPPPPPLPSSTKPDEESSCSNHTKKKKAGDIKYDQIPVDIRASMMHYRSKDTVEIETDEQLKHLNEHDLQDVLGWYHPVPAKSIKIHPPVTILRYQGRLLGDGRYVPSDEDDLWLEAQADRERASGKLSEESSSSGEPVGEPSKDTATKKKRATAVSATRVKKYVYDNLVPWCIDSTGFIFCSTVKAINSLLIYGVRYSERTQMSTSLLYNVDWIFVHPSKDTFAFEPIIPELPPPTELVSHPETTQLVNTTTSTNSVLTTGLAPTLGSVPALSTTNAPAKT